MNSLRPKTKIAMSYAERMRHTIGWTLLLCFFLFGALEAGWPFWFSIATQSPYWILYIIAFYSLLYRVCPYWHQSRIQFFLRNVAICGFFLLGYVVLDCNIPEYVLDGEAQPTYPLESHIIDAIYMFVFIEFPALGVYFQKYSIAKIEANSQKEIDLIRAEEKLARQELNFYRSEFNTHITFNTLSHIYAKVMDDPELANPVLVLSDILRYNLTVQAHHEVPIEQEIDYLKSFIQIHRVLFPKLQVVLTVKGRLNDGCILPRILISFVENAIKHGDKSSVSHPIRIFLKVDEHIHFSVENRKKRKTRISKTSTKTGLKNTRKTLEAFYRDHYHLIIEEDDTDYRVRLSIDRMPHRIESESDLIVLT